MTAGGSHARGARDGILPHGVGGGGDRDGNIWASPVAGVGIMAMMVVMVG